MEQRKAQDRQVHKPCNSIYCSPLTGLLCWVLTGSIRPKTALAQSKRRWFGQGCSGQGGASSIKIVLRGKVQRICLFEGWLWYFFVIKLLSYVEPIDEITEEGFSNRVLGYQQGLEIEISLQHNLVPSSPQQLPTAG